MRQESWQAENLWGSGSIEGSRDGERELGEVWRAPDWSRRAEEFALGLPCTSLLVEASRGTSLLGWWSLPQTTWTLRLQDSRQPTLAERDKDQTQSVVKGEQS